MRGGGGSGLAVLAALVVACSGAPAGSLAETVTPEAGVTSEGGTVVDGSPASDGGAPEGATSEAGAVDASPSPEASGGDGGAVDACVPMSCAAYGYDCGVISACGEPVNCGSCPTWQVCAPTGAGNKCVTPPEAAPAPPCGPSTCVGCCEPSPDGDPAKAACVAGATSGVGATACGAGGIVCEDCSTTIPTVTACHSVALAGRYCW